MKSDQESAITREMLNLAKTREEYREQLFEIECKAFMEEKHGPDFDMYEYQYMYILFNKGSDMAFCSPSKSDPSGSFPFMSWTETLVPHILFSGWNDADGEIKITRYWEQQ